MEENNMNQNYGAGGGQTDQNQYDGSQPNDGYQSGGYANAGQPDNGYQNGGYTNAGQPDNGYQNGGYTYAGQPDNYYQNSGYSGNSYQNIYQPYNNIPPYQNGQLELEEPVKISEWVWSMVLMMIPCVNIIFMFVFAFSKSEKKSKSNFFKAYLIFFGIVFALMLVVWVFCIYAILAFAD